ncbi:alpha-ketoglutarate-dependent dioxygenase AlkB [Tahibacter caeni]|uniref:alpha-ketoglutarate-dependent dioxygenase AlkB n=1 Tax=Tahibacter caeni TaxID=1453545 RepID=UPI0021474D40|nr:alpha-ketoglutarate-dependent dioxygenase AlkB [Tahibacter caeni]
MDFRQSQPGLFDAAATCLVDDALGRIDYHAGFVPAAAAADAFGALLREVPWHAERRRMYEREVDTPRLLASYALDAAVPPAIAALVPRVAAQAGAPFTHVGLNLYRDERDSVAPHNDHLEELQPGQPIALISLGATREMVIRAKRPPRRVLRLPLEAGSLLLMSYATQLHYDHGVPKQRTPVGARISLAFRVRRPAAERARY